MIGRVLLPPATILSGAYRLRVAKAPDEIGFELPLVLPTAAAPPTAATTPIRASSVRYATLRYKGVSPAAEDCEEPDKLKAPAAPPRPTRQPT